jgi:hypothetical protein
MLLLQFQIVSLYDPQKLPYLVRLCLAADFLKVHHLRGIRVREDVVAAGNTNLRKPESFNQVYHIAKGDVVQGPVR